MKKAAFLLILICSMYHAESKKWIMPFEVLIGSADLIVSGEIHVVNERTYSFKVLETLKGETYDLITVNKFAEWTCDMRFAPHEVGQKLCLFLKKDKQSWTIIGASTGEIPILLSDTLQLKEFYRKEVGSNSFEPIKVEYSQFKEAITAFCSMYVYLGDYFSASEEAEFVRISSLDVLFGLKEHNDFAAWLAERMRTHTVHSE